MNMIYHYTTLRNLLKMWHYPDCDELKTIEDNDDDGDWGYYLNFHASDVRMMNDKNENKLINDIVQNAPKELWQSLEFETYAKGPLFAISFCKRKDYIPMWEIYTHHNDGICLGFCVDNLEDKIVRLNKNDMCREGNFRLDECKYLTPSAMRAESENIIKELEELNAPKYGGNILPLEKEIRRIMMQSAFCKSKDFEYEQEVRLSVFSLWDSQIKEGKNGVTLYKQIKVPFTQLKEIIIGPFSKDKDIIQLGIDRLLFDLRPLKKYGIEIKVEYSKLELR